MQPKPRTKAKQLIQTFKGKEGAISCANEILKNEKSRVGILYSPSRTQYWKEIKKELKSHDITWL